MILIQNGTVFTMVGKPIVGGAVLIENRHIKQVFHGNEALPPLDHDNIQVIDAMGGWILPGIIESHCHIGITEAKKGTMGEDCNETVDPITPWLSALDAVNPLDPAFHDAVRSGITCVMTGPGSSNVVGGQFILMKTHGRIVDDMVIAAPAAMKIALGENPKANYMDLGKPPATRMAIAAMLRQELYDALAYKRKKETCLQNEDDFDPEFRYECWLPVLEGKIPIKAHVHRTDDIMTAIRIAREFGLKMTLDHCSEGHIIAERLALERFPAIVGPSVAFRNKVEVENMRPVTAGVLHKAGVTISITTDHPVCMIETLPICAGLAVKEGLPLEEGLRAITLNAALICNAAHRIGSLRPGYDADIAIFDGNPMETLTNTLYTIIDGSVVYDHRKGINKI